MKKRKSYKPARPVLLFFVRANCYYRIFLQNFISGALTLVRNVKLKVSLKMFWLHGVMWLPLVRYYNWLFLLPYNMIVFLPVVSPTVYSPDVIYLEPLPCLFLSSSPSLCFILFLLFLESISRPLTDTHMLLLYNSPLSLVYCWVKVACHYRWRQG